MAKNHFSPKELRLLTGITYRQIQYHDWGGLLRPSKRTRSLGGARSFRLYTFSDALRAHIIIEARARHSIQVIRAHLMPQITAIIRQLTWPLSETTFLFTRDHVIAHSGGHELNRQATRDYQVVRAADLRAAINRLWPDWDAPVPIRPDLAQPGVVL